MEAATAQKMVRFISKGRNYRATLLAPVDHPHPITGQRIVDQEGFTAEFARQPFLPEQHDTDGSFQWPEGELYVDPISGAEVDVVARLRAHEHLNQFFVELGPTPEELSEAQRAVLGEIAKATREGNADRLAEIYDAEERGNRREPILSAALEAMKAIEG